MRTLTEVDWGKDVMKMKTALYAETMRRASDEQLGRVGWALDNLLKHIHGADCLLPLRVAAALVECCNVYAEVIDEKHERAMREIERGQLASNGEDIGGIEQLLRAMTETMKERSRKDDAEEDEQPAAI